MNTLRTHSAPRVGLLVALLLSWLAFSNRCALGRLLPVSQATAIQHQCCESKQEQPEKIPADSNSLDCCKVVHALAGPESKTTIVDVVMLSTAIVFVVDLPETQMQAFRAVNLGPPGEVSSFAEQVLHRSMRSHAPPPCG